MPTAPPRRCRNLGCPHTMPCPAHSAKRGWATKRKHELPPDWHQRRLQVLTRDAYRCQCTGCPRCQGTPCAHPATDVDHRERGQDHTLGNLQSLCRPCHGYKTTMEAAHARATKRYT